MTVIPCIPVFFCFFVLFYQIYLVIDEIRRFQKDVYNFQEVSEIRDYLANEKIHTEKELYDISCQFEPGLPRRHSEADKSFSSRPVPQFKSNTVGRMAGKRCMSLSRSTTTLEGAVPDSTCWRYLDVSAWRRKNIIWRKYFTIIVFLKLDVNFCIKKQ